jgi:hypothetical protein
MKAIDTSTLRDGGSTTENLWIYNGLDCCITLRSSTPSSHSSTT